MMYESYSYYYKRRVLLIFLVKIEIWLNYGAQDAILSSPEALMVSSWKGKSVDIIDIVNT